MVKLTKDELRRKTIYKRVEIVDGMSLDELVAEMGPGAILCREYGYYDDPDTYYAEMSREETIEEYNQRLDDILAHKKELQDRILANKAKKEAKERREYLRLRKKFEGKSTVA